MCIEPSFQIFYVVFFVRLYFLDAQDKSSVKSMSFMVYLTASSTVSNSPEMKAPRLVR